MGIFILFSDIRHYLQSLFQFILFDLTSVWCGKEELYAVA